MYQGSNKKACTSQRQIADALLSLMAERPFADLTVSAICRQADISRATFYSLFRSKENVVTYLLMQDCCDMPEEEDGDMLRALCRGYGAYVSRQAGLLRLLSDNHILSLLQGILSDLFAGCDSLLSCACEELRPYAANYAAAGLTGIAETYVKEGGKAGELEEIAYALLHGDLFAGRPSSGAMPI